MDQKQLLLINLAPSKIPHRSSEGVKIIRIDHGDALLRNPKKRKEVTNQILEEINSRLNEVGSVERIVIGIMYPEHLGFALAIALKISMDGGLIPMTRRSYAIVFPKITEEGMVYDLTKFDN